MKRNKHNLSHRRLTTGDMGELLPIGCLPVLPGDTIQHATSVVIRAVPQLAPIMHPVVCRVHHMFVPNRLIWNNGTTDTNGKFEDFITGGSDGNNAENPPQIITTGTAGDLLDQLGLPLVSGISVNAMPVRAVNACYNEYYRDQDLCAVRDLDDLTIPKIAWEKDNYTSARPWAHKGDDITLPLGGLAPVKGIGIQTTGSFSGGPGNVYETGETAATTWAAWSATQVMEEDTSNPGFPGVYADLQNATGAPLTDVKRAFALQRYQDARARYGSRYTEYLRYLGVNPADSRLQRPEYLSGGMATINFSEVLATSTNANNWLGDMGGHGIAAMRSNRYRRFIEEHGYIVTFLSVRPKALYLDGIPRDWLKMDKEDFYQRELEHIGQQEVFVNEVYADATTGGDTFGYQDRYYEYREQPSQVSGDFRSTLDFHHLGRHFASQPTLNSSFVECSPSKRIFTTSTNDVLWILAQHHIGARRMVGRANSGRTL